MEVMIIGSVVIFLTISFIEVVDEKNEFLFVKTYSFDKYDYVSASMAGSFAFMMFYGAVFVLLPYVDSLPDVVIIEQDANYTEPRAITWFSIYDDLIGNIVP